jgi:hypothetical protein
MAPVPVAGEPGFPAFDIPARFMPFKQAVSSEAYDMIWIEIIRTQAVTSPTSELENSIRDLVRESASIPELLMVKALRSTTHPEERCIALVWFSTRQQESGSALGFSIVSELERFGPVDHSIWHEVLTPIHKQIHIDK